MRTRIFTLLVAFLAIAGNAVWGQETSWTGEGTGTPEDPYQISTPDELKAFRDLVNGGDADACAILKNDIELDSSEEWEPIGYVTTSGWTATITYTGTFDGASHKIEGLNLVLDSKNKAFAGLFSVIGTYEGNILPSFTPGGKVANLTVEGFFNYTNLKNAMAGGICTYNVGNISNCKNLITISGEYLTAGGICSYNMGSIENCSNEATISTGSCSGGICGMNGGSIKTCYNKGAIFATIRDHTEGYQGSAYAGGISGDTYNKKESIIENCYNAGKVTAITLASGICNVSSAASSGSLNIKNCHNYESIETATHCAGITVQDNSGPTSTTVEINNCYYLNEINAGLIIVSNSTEEEIKDAPGVCESKTETEFADGTVLYLLQSGNPGDDKVWEQTIGTDKYPVFDASSTPSVVYQVTVQPNDATMGTTTGGGVYVANEEATVTATPNEGYEFINWTIGEEEQSTETTYTFEVTASVTLIANFQKIDEGGEEEPGDDDEDQGDTGIHKPQRPIKYYNIYVDTICPGLNVEVSKDVVQEGHQVSAYLTIQAECDTTGMRFEYKRSLFGYWKDLKELEGVQPGEYIIKNIYTDIYIRALDATPEEEPTGIENLEGVKAYAKDGSIYVYTPNREEVTIISMSGAIIKNAEQIGLQSYNVSRGIYIVRIGEKVFKLKN